VDLRFFPALDTRGMPDEKASWNKMKEDVEKCWDEAERDLDQYGN
jgi:hypothetical protein